MSSTNLNSLSNNQKTALLTLLTDEDSSVYQTVRTKIISYGPEAKDWMQTHSLSTDRTLRRRATEIVQFIDKQSADNTFVAFCLGQGEDLDIEEGAFLLALTQFPEINVQAYSALLDSYSSDVRERLGGANNGEAIIATFNQYIFTELGYRANENNYYDPENSYLNRVMDKRVGNPISLCLLYLFLGKRLQIPLAGIGMPGHFLCRFQTPTEEIFIDAFHHGKLLTKADCIKYLQHTRGFQESYLAPISPRRMLLRICSNLHQIYLQMNSMEETSRFQRYIVALAK